VDSYFVANAFTSRKGVPKSSSARALNITPPPSWLFSVFRATFHPQWAPLTASTHLSHIFGSALGFADQQLAGQQLLAEVRAIWRRDALPTWPLLWGEIIRFVLVVSLAQSCTLRRARTFSLPEGNGSGLRVCELSGGRASLNKWRRTRAAALVRTVQCAAILPITRTMHRRNERRRSSGRDHCRPVQNAQRAKLLGCLKQLDL